MRRPKSVHPTAVHMRIQSDWGEKGTPWPPPPQARVREQQAATVAEQAAVRERQAATDVRQASTEARATSTRPLFRST